MRTFPLTKEEKSVVFGESRPGEPQVVPRCKQTNVRANNAKPHPNELTSQATCQQTNMPSLTFTLPVFSPHPV